jgi:hypothetical protein
MTRNRWDDMRTLIEAGWHNGWGGCGESCEFAGQPQNYCAKFGCIKAAHLSDPADIDTKQAQHDGSRQIYGDAGTFMRGGEPGC